jgi:ubiquinone/menaquinone biosynthesis C-methylase UbiE
MDHADHVALLKNGIPEPGSVWADFGSGRGAFTLALAELIGPGGIIYSVDKNANALQQQKSAMRAQFPGLMVHYLDLDYTQPLDLPPLDGIVIANALHFQRGKDRVLQGIKSYLGSQGRLIIVEYNIDRGNTWVPYPISFEAWAALAHRNGFSNTRLLARRPSSFLREIYAAVSFVEEYTPDGIISDSS